MKKLILPAVVLLAVAGLVKWPDRQGTVVPAVVELPPANGGAQDLRGTRRTAPTLPGEEVELSLLDFDEVKDNLADYTQAELIERFNPKPIESQGLIEALTSQHPLDRAEAIYDSKWKSFVDSLGLPDSERNRIRDILLAHETHNIELRDLVWTRQISSEQHRASWRSLEQLAGVLAPMLSENQITQFWDHQERQSDQFRRQVAEWNAEYLESGMVGILDAANRNDSASVQAYINSGADVNAITLDGRHTPLLDAASRGNIEMTRMLLAAGADPNITSADGYEVTPLRTAAKKGHTEIILALSSAGADLNFGSEGSPGLSPLAIAAQYGQAFSVAALLELGADATGTAGARALTHSVRYGNPEIEQMLIEAGASDDILTTATREFKEIGRRLGVVND